MQQCLQIPANNVSVLYLRFCSAKTHHVPLPTFDTLPPREPLGEGLEIDIKKVC